MIGLAGCLNIRNFAGHIVLAIVIFVSSAAPGKADVAEQPVPCTLSSKSGLNEVWRKYVEGLRTGDIERLGSIFASDGVFIYVKGTKSAHDDAITGQTFAQVLPQWVSKPDPEAQGKISEVVAVQRVGVIRGELLFDTMQYNDTFTLNCLDGHWQIVRKVSYAQPR